MKIQTLNEKKQEIMVQLNKDDILNMLKDLCVIPKEFNSSLVYTVTPAGGDYRGDNVEIDNDGQDVIVSVIKIEKEK